MTAIYWSGVVASESAPGSAAESVLWHSLARLWHRRLLAGRRLCFLFASLGFGAQSHDVGKRFTTRIGRRGVLAAPSFLDVHRERRGGEDIARQAVVHRFTRFRRVEHTTLERHVTGECSTCFAVGHEDVVRDLV